MAKLYTTAELAVHLNVKPSTMRHWRRRNYGPPYLMVGNHARYPEDSFKRWLDDRLIKAR